MQKVRNNLALLTSPGQYYYFLEYLYQQKLDKNNFDLIIFWNEFDTVSKSFFNEIHLQNQWRKITFFKLWNYNAHILNKIKTFIKLLGLISKIKAKEYEKTVCSQLHTIYNLQIINSLKINEIISLDEGNAVFLTVELRRKFANKRSLNYLGLKTYFPKKITFFTSYNNIEILENDKTIECTYEFSKNKFNNVEVSQNMLFVIGQPFVYLGLMSCGKYKDYLKKIRDKYSQCNHFYYLPHRREELTQIKEMCSSCSIKLIESNQPIELNVLIMKKIPKYVVGFNSAALLNLKRILPEQIKIISIRIPDNDINICKIYKEFEKAKIQVIDLCQE